MTRSLRPINGSDVVTFLGLYRRVCPTVNDEVSVEEFADMVGWTVEKTETVALWLDERGLIETDRGMGQAIKVIEGRSGT